MQEVITYSIIAATVGYVVYRIVKMFIQGKKESDCETSACAGCGIQSKCTDDRKNTTLISAIVILLMWGSLHTQVLSDMTYIMQDVPV